MTPSRPLAPATFPCFLVPLALVLAACGAGDRAAERAAGWAVDVDTLPNGALRVINRPPVEGADPPERWSVVEDLRIGMADGPPAYVFGDVRAIEVDEAGRIYALDAQAQEVRVFGPDGGHIRTLGGRGGGPGELQNATGLALGPDGALWVPDQRNQRYSVFEPDGTLRASLRTPMLSWAFVWEGGVDREGRLHDVDQHPPDAREPSRMFRRFDGGHELEAAFALPEYDGPPNLFQVGGNYMGVPFAPRLVFRFDPRGYVWFASGHRYTVFQRRLEGDTVLVIESSRPPRPVAAAQRDSAAERVRDWERRARQAPPVDVPQTGLRPDPALVPTHRPVFERLDVDDDGRLWILIDLREDHAVFDVFAPDGRYLAEASSDFRPMDAFRAIVIRGGAMYAVARDELGVPSIVRGAIRRGGEAVAAPGPARVLRDAFSRRSERPRHIHGAARCTPLSKRSIHAWV